MLPFGPLTPKPSVRFRRAADDRKALALAVERAMSSLKARAVQCRGTTATATTPAQREQEMTTTDWDAVDWSNDADIIASVAPWITPQELYAIRRKAAGFKPTQASSVAIKFTLAEAVIDAAVKAIAPPHRPVRRKDIAVTVQFDEVSATWHAVDDDGVVIADDFETNTAAWQWVDDHGSNAARRG
jgi:hypothetical protein